MKAYEMAGIDPEDVGLAEVHDAVAPAEISIYEDLRFCARGDGPKLIEDRGPGGGEAGALRLDVVAGAFVQRGEGAEASVRVVRVEPDDRFAVCARACGGGRPAPDE